MKKHIERIAHILDFRALIMFLTVGTISAVINFSSFAFFWNFLHIHYQVAVSISYILSVIFHFNVNRRFTFKSHGRNFHRHLAKYLIMILISYLTTLAIMHIVVEIFKFSPYVGIVASIGTTVGMNYMLAKFWVFI